jgi:hypothetical protein
MHNLVRVFNVLGIPRGAPKVDERSVDSLEDRPKQRDRPQATSRSELPKATLVVPYPAPDPPKATPGPPGPARAPRRPAQAGPGRCGPARNRPAGTVVAQLT